MSSLPPERRRDHLVARVIDDQARWVVLIYGAWRARILGGAIRSHWKYERLDAVGAWQDEKGWLLRPKDERIEELDTYIAESLAQGAGK